MYLVTAEEMQRMDRETIESFGVPGRVLMENAARGATRFLLDRFPDLGRKRVGVMAGRGNNGGDGHVMARYLFQKGIRVAVYLLSEKEKVKGDAAANLELLDKLGVPVVELPDEAAFNARRTELAHQDLWIDAILGTGLGSEVRGYFRSVIDYMNESGKPIFAVDIPSGLHSDTGHPLGVCIRAAATATFAYPKIGHLTYPGAELAGELRVIDIGIPPHIAGEIGPRQEIVTPSAVRRILGKRAPDAHKGTTGHLLVVAGSPGKSGAAAMAAMSALRIGAGLVTLCVPKSLNAIMEGHVLEAMTYPLPETGAGILDENVFKTIFDLFADKQCVALGPGLGGAAQTGALVRRLIAERRKPMVIDADGLNHLVGHTDILKSKKPAVILTPHPGEMARLTNLSTAEIQRDRVGVARRFAVEWQAHLVLKGARTVIAHPDGRVHVNPTGNPGMASGGMGDVLTGIIAGLATQGCPPEAAARAGVYLHGAAADRMAGTMGPYGYLASDLMAALPGEIGRMTSADASEAHPWRPVLG